MNGFENLSIENSMKIENCKLKIRKHAFASLPVILLIGGMLVELGIAGAFVAYFLSQSGLAVRLSQDAFSAAQAGVEDALIRIVRDKNFNPSPNPYVISIGNSAVQITVCKDTCAGVNKFQIDSLGTSLNKARKIRAIIGVNGLTGEVKLESENEIAL